MKFPAFKPIKLNTEAPLFEVFEIEIQNILPDINQPRKNFDIATLNDLAASIGSHGIIQPIIVKKISEDEFYQIIAGERRWRAAKLAGLTKIPCIIREFKKVDQTAIALIENIQREDLNPLEEAEAIQSLIQECGFTHKQVADTLGKSRTAVSNLLRLLQLETEVKDFVILKQLEMGHARALLRTKGNMQVNLAKKIISQHLSVRETEKLLQKSVLNLPSLPPRYTTLSEEILEKWSDRLSKCLSLKVETRCSLNGKGKVVIYLNTISDVERMMDKIPLLIDEQDK